VKAALPVAFVTAIVPCVIFAKTDSSTFFMDSTSWKVWLGWSLALPTRKVGRAISTQAPTPTKSVGEPENHTGFHGQKWPANAKYGVAAFAACR
jgi:hypothetical protein